MKTIYVITPDRLVEVGDKYVVRLFESDKLETKISDDEKRPCIEGDVLSIDPDGHAGGRVEGTSGPYELCEVIAKGLLYSPSGPEGKSYLVPYVE